MKEYIYISIQIGVSWSHWNNRIINETSNHTIHSHSVPRRYQYWICLSEYMYTLNRPATHKRGVVYYMKCHIPHIQFQQTLIPAGFLWLHFFFVTFGLLFSQSLEPKTFRLVRQSGVALHANYHISHKSLSSQWSAREKLCSFSRVGLTFVTWGIDVSRCFQIWARIFRWKTKRNTKKMSTDEHVVKVYLIFWKRICKLVVFSINIIRLWVKCSKESEFEIWMDIFLWNIEYPCWELIRV